MIRTVKGELDEIDSFIDWKLTVDNNLLEYIKNKTILMLLKVFCRYSIRNLKGRKKKIPHSKF